MLIAQDWICSCLPGLNLTASLIRIRNSLKLWFVWVFFFLPECLFETFIWCETLFHSVLLFQIRKHISDAMCHAMYDCTWMKYLCIRFTFMVFFFIKFATFSPIHTLRACWCSLFLLLGDISISMLAHRIMSLFLETKTVLVQAFMYETQVFSYALDFTTLVLSLNSV